MTETIRQVNKNFQFMKCFAGLLVLLFCSSGLSAQQVDIKIPAHDPVMIKQDNTYYMFCTGLGISVYSSTDMKSWKRRNSVFSKPPEWAVRAVPGFKGHVWAPDISYRNGKYYLYYAVSAFGKNTSCIGVAVNATLDSTSANFEWKDLGKVIQSVPGRDMWNAIDPNLLVDENNTPWLAFGSFWEGMKMVKLNAEMTALAQPEEWYTIARRPRDFSARDSSPGNAAIEAPFIFKKDKYYYLFVSWDYCCRAEKSDYKVVVGRSENATGPFLDKTGKSMFMGGGSLVLEGDNKLWYGAGHNSAYTFDEKDYIIYHGYDAQDKGRSKLMIRNLKWSDGWPEVQAD
ncbi:arabinan endo-1,5-alpha-L-arabinosidase [Segetibacter aerophilus]|uniref:Extracellular endo-alpha-(1->5)-L-arabinanase 1 n=1 Tax=Segetibacter aerophilus TaxID=670293 RepID=A0A512B893_9BACT|nr:arabinan endo-1,5-alpha-L-arabinosidase [Segetibacter aerophilus]GEO08047.1 extracellular endo-alpha-(1->5)-L-arabinanase 1 [Segetibacter aerophilus]